MYSLNRKLPFPTSVQDLRAIGKLDLPMKGVLTAEQELLLTTLTGEPQWLQGRCRDESGTGHPGCPNLMIVVPENTGC